MAIMPFLNMEYKMHKYYFEINGEEFLIRVNISTGKYQIFNGKLELVEEDHTLFEVTKETAYSNCLSIYYNFIDEQYAS
tara:strand:+ start:1461 stop:1697 length:237 start_codon:yes stop_codon:yes gene_type:complete